MFLARTRFEIGRRAVNVRLCFRRRQEVTKAVLAPPQKFLGRRRYAPPQLTQRRWKQWRTRRAGPLRSRRGGAINIVKLCSARLANLLIHSVLVRKAPRGSTYLPTKYTNPKRTRTILKALTMHIGKDIFFTRAECHNHKLRRLQSLDVNDVQSRWHCSLVG